MARHEISCRLNSGDIRRRVKGCDCDQKAPQPGYGGVSWLLDSNGFTPKKQALAVAFAFLWTADVVTTIAFTTKHGLEMEANPLMREVIAELGYGGFSLIKLAVLIMWFALAGRMATWLLVGAVAVMLPIVIVNSIVAWYPI